MNQKLTKIVFYFTIAITIISILATGYRYLIIRDYEVYDDTEDYLSDVTYE